MLHKTAMHSTETTMCSMQNYNAYYTKLRANYISYYVHNCITLHYTALHHFLTFIVLQSSISLNICMLYFCFYTDFLKAFSLPPIPDITTLITTSQTMDTNIATIDTTVSEQFARPAGAPSASRNPSITDVNSIPQLPQGVLHY